MAEAVPVFSEEAWGILEIIIDACMDLHYNNLGLFLWGKYVHGIVIKYRE